MKHHNVTKIILQTINKPIFFNSQWLKPLAICDFWFVNCFLYYFITNNKITINEKTENYNNKVS